jgi:hypothetical protein
MEQMAKEPMFLEKSHLTHSIIDQMAKMFLEQE